MKTIKYLQDFHGNLPDNQNKVQGDVQEVADNVADSLVLRGIAEIHGAVKQKEEKHPLKTKEEKRSNKTK